jgi:DNA-nicking Smr family endonuclease
MKDSKSSFNYNPFDGLKELLNDGYALLLDYNLNSVIVGTDAELTPHDEKKLFEQAMKDVIPISRGNSVERITGAKLPEISKIDTDAEVFARLRNLIEKGDGFTVADTPEYIEGTGYSANRIIVERLHRGDFSIQAHIDLHGLNADDAREVIENFLKESIVSGKRAVLIIHGRGLSSPVKPVLKTKVIEWLTAGLWRKWVIAYSSARLCDGGAGATYVLLRQRPLTKRFRKKRGMNKKVKNMVSYKSNGGR